MLSRLGDLETADPDKLQATLETVADRLRAASMEKGGAEGERLAVMADKADAAARTGDLSKLKPPPERRGGPSPEGEGPDRTLSPAEKVDRDLQRSEEAEAS